MEFVRRYHRLRVDAEPTVFEGPVLFVANHGFGGIFDLTADLMVDPAPVVKPPHDKFRHGDGAGPRLGPHIRVAGHAHPPMLRLLGIRPRYNGYTENVFPALPFHAGMSGRAHPEPPSRTR